ncbi:MAG: hypothetical protein FJZ60_01355, partial [Chlamydiae bacterium]|nr:hypothetical protein [Chlamydiota bacterium]
VDDPAYLFYAQDEDCGLVQNGVSYGIEKGDIQAFDLKTVDDGTQFSIIDHTDGSSVVTVYIPLIGIHQVKNALAVFGLAKRLGVPVESIQKGFTTFKGVRRRLERLQTHFKVATFLDYGHHPKELTTTFLGLKNQYQKRLIVVFEPHKFTRTKSFFSEFIEALKIPDRVILLQTYPAQEPYDYEGSSEKLAEKLQIQVTQKDQLKAKIDTFSLEDTILLFIGAGTIDQVCQEFVL